MQRSQIEFSQWRLDKAPLLIKRLIFILLIVLTTGYTLGFLLINETTSLQPRNIVTHYNGNESDLDAEVLKFKKSRHEILVIIHTHLLGLSPIFLLLAMFVYFCEMKDSVKGFLMLEPTCSLFITFSSIYGIWLGVEWMSWITMLSGGLMHLSFYVSVVIVVWNLCKKKT